VKQQKEKTNIYWPSDRRVQTYVGHVINSNGVRKRPYACTYRQHLPVFHSITICYSTYLVKVRIATEHGSLNHIHQMVPVCNVSDKKSAMWSIPKLCTLVYFKVCLICFWW